MFGSKCAIVLDIESGPTAAAFLAAGLGAASVGAVLIRAREGSSVDAKAVAPLIAMAQQAGVAVLIEADARLAVALGADGVHLRQSDTLEQDYAAVRAIVGKQRIVGAECGLSRHDAMVLAEAGADYIGFCLPPDCGADRDSADVLVDIVAWWAEIVEVACVAFARGGLEEALALAAAGADFVRLAVQAGEPPAAYGERLAVLRRKLSAQGGDITGGNSGDGSR